MLQRLIILALLGGGSAELVSGSWLLAKAQLAQLLIAHAWQQVDGYKPWPWADTWPVLRLQAPALGVDLYVLEGGQGNALAFGPARMYSHAAGAGLVIAGHRDTHFEFLKNVQPGDKLMLTARASAPRSYRVSRSLIVDSRQHALAVDADELVLVTCYPFAATSAGGPMRYLVYAKPLQ